MASSELLHSEWFVPSLDEISDTFFDAPRQCFWHLLKRSGGQLVRCSNHISERDANAASTIISNLQYLQRQPRTRANKKEYIHNLRRLALLFLCSSPHRSSHAEVISQYWESDVQAHLLASGLTQPTHALDTITRLNSKNLTTAPQPDGLLVKQQSRSETKLHFYKGAQLEEPDKSTSSKNEARVITIMGELARYLYFSKTGLQLLGELGHLIGCPQDELLPKLTESAIPPISKVSLEFKAQNLNPVHTPMKREGTLGGEDYPTIPDSQNSTGSSIGSAVWSTPGRSGSPASNFSTPDNSVSAGKISFGSPPMRKDVRDDSPTPTPMVRRSLTWPKVQTELQFDSPLPLTPLSKRTRAHPRSGLDTFAEMRCFEPLLTPKSQMKATKDMRGRIEKELSKLEIPSGFVYGFRHPHCALIKIGYTAQSDIKQRMKSIEKECKYLPKVVFAIGTDHARRVEFLVHRHLYMYRRRETLIFGACNGGKGCSKNHIEWFDVDDKLACSVVNAWVRWMNKSPYDENRCLKSIWIEQMKVFSWDVDGDIWMEWTKVTVFKDIFKVEEEAPLATVKKEEDDSPTKLKEMRYLRSKKSPLVTVLEVKQEDD